MRDSRPMSERLDSVPSTMNFGTPGLDTLTRSERLALRSLLIRATAVAGRPHVPDELDELGPRGTHRCTSGGSPAPPSRRNGAARARRRRRRQRRRPSRVGRTAEPLVAPSPSRHRRAQPDQPSVRRGRVVVGGDEGTGHRRPALSPMSATERTAISTSCSIGRTSRRRCGSSRSSATDTPSTTGHWPRRCWPVRSE